MYHPPIARFFGLTFFGGTLCIGYLFFVYVTWISALQNTDCRMTTLILVFVCCLLFPLPSLPKIVSIVFRKFSFILNRLNCNVPVKPLHVKGACTELALDAAREHRYHQAGGK